MSEEKASLVGSAEMSAMTKAEKVARFTAGVDKQEQMDIDFWRNASPAQHARAAVELAEAGERLGLTAIEKERADRVVFPGIPQKKDSSR